VTGSTTKAKYILIDTDVWVGFFVQDDRHHKAATKLLSGIRKRRDQIFITEAIVGETITVLSHKKGQDAARKFLKMARNPDKNNLINVPINGKLYTQALDVFEKHDEKGTSYVDCSNVAVIRSLDLDQVCAFDKVYHSQFGLDNLTYPQQPAA